MALSTSTVTLAPGESRTYTLAPGEAVTVNCDPNVICTVTETPDVIATADQAGQTNNRVSNLQYRGNYTYGPYMLGGTVAVEVSVRSTSSVSVTVSSSAAAVVGAANFGGLLERYGVVANGVTDDSSALQEAILAARSAGVAQVLPMDIQTIKLNSGITLFADSDRFISQRPVTLDCSGITSGNAINIDCSITDGNVAPFSNIRNFMSGFFLQGAGSPSVAGASGVNAFRFYSASGKPYFYQVKNCAADGFATTVDLSSNTFGIAFEDFAARSGIGGTLIQCLTGGGANYGERYNFTRAMLYNSGTALINTNPATTFRFLNSSFDYCGVMADVRAGRVSLESCHVETNLDTDYLFKVSGNESSSLMIDKSEIVLNGVVRTKELFDIDSAVLFGGISVRDSMISHGSGYSPLHYVRGSARAVATGLVGFSAQSKPVFSRWQSGLRDGTNDANAVAEFTLSQTGTAVVPAYQATASSSPPFSGGCLEFPTGGTTGIAQAEVIAPIPIQGGLPRFGFYYRKTDASPTAGQGKIQVTWAFLDSKGTVIGSTSTLLDTDGTLNAWTAVRLGPTTPPPIGARSVRIRIIKSADSDGSATFQVQGVAVTFS